MPAYQAEKSSSSTQGKDLAYGGSDDAGEQAEAQQRKGKNREDQCGQREVYPCRCGGKVGGEGENDCEGGAGNPILAQYQAQQEEYEKEEHGGEDGVANRSDDAGKFGAYTQHRVQRREQRLMVVAMERRVHNIAKVEDDAKDGAIEQIPADQRIGSTFRGVARPGNHGARPLAPHPGLQSRIEDPDETSVDEGATDTGPEVVDFPERGGVVHLQQFDGRQTEEINEAQPGSAAQVGASAANIEPDQDAGGDERNIDDCDEGQGRRAGGRGHAAGDGPWTDDAVEDGAAAPGGGFDAQVGSGGGVGAGPGGASVPVGERSPGRFGGLKLRGIEPGSQEELVPIEWRGGWGRFFHLGWDGFEADEFAVRVGFEAQHAGLVERRIVVVHGHMELALGGKRLGAFAIPEMDKGRLARGRIAPTRFGFFRDARPRRPCSHRRTRAPRHYRRVWRCSRSCGCGCAHPASGHRESFPDSASR